MEIAAFTQVAVGRSCSFILRSNCLKNGGMGSTKTEYDDCFCDFNDFHIGSLLLLPVLAPMTRKVSPADFKNVPASIICHILEYHNNKLNMEHKNTAIVQTNNCAVNTTDRQVNAQAVTM